MWTLKRIKAFSKLIFKKWIHCKIMELIINKIILTHKTINNLLIKIITLIKTIIQKWFSSQFISTSCTGRFKVLHLEQLKVLWRFPKHLVLSLKTSTSIWQKMSKKVQKFWQLIQKAQSHSLFSTTKSWQKVQPFSDSSPRWLKVLRNTIQLILWKDIKLIRLLTIAEVLWDLKSIQLYRFASKLWTHRVNLKILKKKPFLIIKIKLRSNTKNWKKCLNKMENFWLDRVLQLLTIWYFLKFNKVSWFLMKSIIIQN